MSTSSTDIDPRRQARTLYWQGWRVSSIARFLGEKVPTVHSWKRRDGWDRSDEAERIGSSLEARLHVLIAKEKKEGCDYKEIDLLMREIERLARVRKYEGTGRESDLNPNILARNAKPKKQPKKNFFSDEQIEALTDKFHENMFGYQKIWYRAGKSERIRNILKSRQIGATYYFAREALIDALETGRNQIFLSASKAQAFQFRSYIVDFAAEVGVKLTGDNIKLSNGAELIFLGTNSRTAQSYHGNLYIDEIFWIQNFQKLRTVASGMASQKRWRQTLFSTPSTMSHEAYPFWSGELYNRGRAKTDRIKIDISHAALAGGMLCADGMWRHIVTLSDAERSGCDLFDIEQLRREYSPAEFAMLFDCQFIDDGTSVFPFSMLTRCIVDSWDIWLDFKPFSARPYGDRPVWLGYDPSDAGDSAALVVIAPPAVVGGKFRVLERHEFNGADFKAQADFIKGITEKYNVEYIGIDKTGVGAAVYQLVKLFFPAVVGLNYSVETKTMMVLKTLDVLGNGRLEFDAGWTEMSASFMAIKKTMTASGGKVTYDASRDKNSNHGDLAWAVMHALMHEPLEGKTENNTGSVLIW
ncbi:terminase ATPase subunit family protein [Rivihabitans pingtungensis]|nr:terminase ATPase subunit family protein [Rivihabitans pingtungensis]